MRVGRIAMFSGGALLLASAFWLWLDAARPRGRALERAAPQGEVSPAARGERAAPGRVAELGIASSREVAPVAPSIVASTRPDAAVDVDPAFVVRVVRWGDEKPLADVRVTAFESDAAVEQWTDEHGRATFRRRPSGECLPLAAEKEGFARRCACHQGPDELTLVLVPAGTLFGRVLDAESGRPVPGARIQQYNECERVEGVASAADGEYELAGVHTREPVYLQLSAEGYPVQMRSFELRSEEPRVEVDLRLERGLEIAGRVVDFETGAGLAGAWVGEIAADSSGAFRGRILSAPGDDAVSLVVRAADHCRLHARVKPATLADPLEFSLPRAALVEGVVRDAQGRPVPGVSVYCGPDHRGAAKAKSAGVQRDPTPLDGLAKDWGYAPDDEHARARADDEGRFRIAGLVPWSQYLSLQAWGEGWQGVQRSISSVGGPGESLWFELRMEPSSLAARVAGWVRLNGEATHTAKGRLSWTGPTRSGEVPVHGGEFHAEVEPGSVAFRLALVGFPSPLEGTEFSLRIEPGAELEHLIELRSATRPIAGRVLFPDGAPVAGATLDASVPLGGAGENDWDRLHVTTKAEEDGSYTLDVPEGLGPYRVVARLDRSESRREGAPAGASGIDLVLERSGVLLFRLRDARNGSFLPATGFGLGWRPVGSADFLPVHLGYPLTPDPEGWLELRLPVGRVDLRVREAFQRIGYLPLLVEGAWIGTEEPLRIDFELTLGRVLELRLAPGTPPLPEGHRVLLVEEDTWAEVSFDAERNSWNGGTLGSALMARSVRFDEHGRATQRGLAPGRLRFKVHPPDLVLEPETIVIGADAPEPVLLRWR